MCLVFYQMPWILTCISTRVEGFILLEKIDKQILYDNNSLKKNIGSNFSRINICDRIWEKDAFQAHNSKTHFSPSNDSCIHWITIQASIEAESCLGCFCCGLFLRLVRRPRVLGLPSNDSISHWQADSWLLFTTRLADEFGHQFSCFVWYVEVKMAPIDVIWLVFVKT